MNAQGRYLMALVKKHGEVRLAVSDARAIYKWRVLNKDSSRYHPGQHFNLRALWPSCFAQGWESLPTIVKKMQEYDRLSYAKIAEIYVGEKKMPLTPPRKKRVAAPVRRKKKKVVAKKKVRSKR